MVQLKELLSSNFLCRRPSQAAASLWPRSLSSRLATGASGNHFNRDLYLALGRVHLLPAIVEEGGVSHQIKCRDLFSPRFTYHLQQSKRVALAIKFNREICSALGQIHLPSAIVKEGSVSHQIQQRSA